MRVRDPAASAPASVEVAAERDVRYSAGEKILHEVNGAIATQFVDALQDVAPGLAQDVVAYGFGTVYARPGLTRQQRQLVTLGMLCALGGAEAQLEVHVGTSLNVGLTPVEIVEALAQGSVYCGFPRALNAVSVARRVFETRGLLPVFWPDCSAEEPGDGAPADTTDLSEADGAALAPR
jgi:4-carboxymuconolactone decarboxylase